MTERKIEGGIGVFGFLNSQVIIELLRRLSPFVLDCRSQGSDTSFPTGNKGSKEPSNSCVEYP